LIVRAFDAMQGAAAALDDWSPDDAARIEARMVYSAAAQMHSAVIASYQVQIDDRIPVPDWIERYLP
jgi:hypothetical protein